MFYGITASEYFPPPIRYGTAIWQGTSNLYVEGQLFNPIQTGTAIFQGASNFYIDGQLSNPIQYITAIFQGTGNLSANLNRLAETFDPNTVTNVNLTNGNLTATHTNTTTNSGAKTSTDRAQSTGKYYWEVTCGAATGNYTAIGGLLTTGTYTNLVTNGTNCFACYKGDTGNAIWANNGSSGISINHFTAGDRIGIAVDLDNHRLWMRKNGAAWVNSGNPEAGTGGITIAAGSWVPAVGFAGNATENMTINCGSNLYGDTPPSGFSNWPTA